MQFSSSLLENAVNEFARLPGIGKKTALRLVLHLLKQDTGEVGRFSEIIARMEQEFGALHYDRRDVHRPMEQSARLIERVRARELDVELPSIYGPSADTDPFA